MLGPITIVGGEQGKGRAFEGAMLAYVTCTAVHFNVGELRPAWAVIATDGGSAKPVLANIRLGRALQFGGKVVKFLARTGYRYDQQVHPEGALFTIYVPQLFAFDAAVDDMVQFVVLVEKARVQAFDWPRAAVQAWLTKVRREMPDDAFALVPFFAAYLDRRCKIPLPSSLKFQAQLLAGLMIENGAFLSGTLNQCKAEGLDTLGLHRALYVSAKHDTFKEFCMEEVQRYVRNGG